MKKLTALFVFIGFAGCGDDPSPKTGVMPGIATGGYDAPSNAEATAAYMAGFHARYKIPELDYPQDIKDRIRKAKTEKFNRDMRKGQKRTELMAKLGLAVMAINDPEAKELLEEIKDAPKANPNIEGMTQLFEMVSAQSGENNISAAQRRKEYDKAVEAYKYNFQSLKIETCRWTEMRKLIGSGHEEMAFIHGVHPTHGFRCVVDLTLEKNKGYPRTMSVDGFWVKSQSGDWDYYGKFRAVGVSPRLQQLNQNLLRDPEGTIRRQSSFDMIAASF